MSWKEDVKGKLLRKNSILFTENNELFEELDDLIQNQNRRTLVLWALDLAEETVKVLESRYPQDKRPRSALDATRLWAAGKIKMNVAKREILNCHAMAKDISNLEDKALCHAVAQACSVVHTSGHALGYSIYEMTSFVRRMGVEDSEEAVKDRSQIYLAKLRYWEEHSENYDGTWASFLKDEPLEPRDENMHEV